MADLGFEGNGLIYIKQSLNAITTKYCGHGEKATQYGKNLQLVCVCLVGQSK